MNGSPRKNSITRGWIALAAFLLAFEFAAVNEAIIADSGGYQRIFGVFAGISILCFGALLYAVSVIFYGWSG